MSSRPPTFVSNVPSPMGKPYADYHGAWFDVKFAGLEELVQRFGTVSPIVGQEIADAILDVSNQGVKLARLTLDGRRKKFDTGDLSASVHVMPVKIGGPRYGSIITGGYETNLFYAFWVEFGRGWVYPIRAKRLSWIDRDTGQRVFAMSSPPASPRPFMEPSSRDVRPYADVRFARSMADIVAYLSGGAR